MKTIWRFSAPGRTEIGGNHTDHQRGCVLAAAVNLETTADVVLNGTNSICIMSRGYATVEIDINDLASREEEKNTTAALVRGVMAEFSKRGCRIKGFDAKVESTVLAGSGLSSSAAFEVLIGTILNTLFFDSKLTPVEIAQIGQYAENVYFGKPCGLMDQTASAVGGMVFIDFENPKSPIVKSIDFDFAHCGYTLCIIDSGADHTNLTDEYTAITQELRKVCAVFDKEVLREVDEADFYAHIKEVRTAAGDRAVLRAIHVFEENKRVQMQVRALESSNFSAFLNYAAESGRSSWQYLQNVVAEGRTAHQEMAFALALCDMLLNGCGAYRVHGGGFAGTVQAFVPNEMLEDFKNCIEAVLGKDSCHVLSIRQDGGMCTYRITD